MSGCHGWAWSAARWALGLPGGLLQGLSGASQWMVGCVAGTPTVTPMPQAILSSHGFQVVLAAVGPLQG